MDPSAPALTLTSVPAWGAFAVLAGRAVNVRPAEWKVAPFIYVPDLGYYSKPTFANNTVPLQNDLTWTASITTGGLGDTMATKIVAYLVPANYPVPLANGAGALPSDLDVQGFPKVVVTRSNPAQKVVHVPGTDAPFYVKSSFVPVFPGPNLFAEDSVIVDSGGAVHLALRNRNGQWQSGEIYTRKSFGYGQYRFYINVPDLDPNVIAGFFTYGEEPSFGHRELDHEVGKFGNSALSTNAQYAVQQPLTVFRYSLPTGGPAVLIIDWQPAGVTFRTVRGTDPNPADPTAVIQQWTSTAPVPDTLDENVRMNMWMVGAPTDGREREVVVNRFEFQPASSDTQAPVLTGAQAAPATLSTAGGLVTLQATVTDNTAVAEVHAEITRPEGSVELVGLTRAAGDAKSGLWTGVYRAAANPGVPAMGYSAVIVARDASQNQGRSAASPFKVFGQGPAAPTGLTGTATGPDTVSLSWTGAPGTGQFVLERSTAGGAFAAIATPEYPLTRYTDIGLTPNTTYHYRVKATNSSGESPYSNEAVVTTPAATLTVTAPNGAEVWAVGDVQSIRWTSAGVSGSMKLELSRDGGSTWETLATPPNSGSFSWTVTGPATKQALIRVSDATGSATDVSDRVFSLVPATSSATFQLQSVSGSTGQTVSMGVQFTANGASVAAAGADLLFDSAQLTFTGASRASLPAGVDVQTQGQGPGRVRLIIVGSTNAAAWTTGRIATLTFQISASARPGGSSTVQLVLPGSSTAGVEVSNKAGDAAVAGAAPGTVTLSARGDLNGNGSVDLGDVQLMINVYLGRAPYNPAIHDLNGNGSLDIGDVQSMANLFLGGSPAAPAGTSRAPSARTVAQKLSFSPGTDAISALAFELDPGSRSVASVTLASSRSDLRLSYARQTSGRIRVLIYSTAGKAIPRSAGLVTVRASGNGTLVPLRLNSQTPGADGAHPDGTLVAIPYRRGTRALAGIH